MSPAPTARARPSPICGRCWKPQACASTSITSPHLVRINECFRLGRAGGGVLVGDDELSAALEECERANAGAPITVFEIETAAAFCLFAQHPADVRAAGGRPRRPARFDQCRRDAARQRDHAGLHGSHGIPGQHAGRDRRREGRHHQARRAGDLAPNRPRGDRGDRGAGEPHARAAVCRRAAMACRRRARPPCLSGRARPARSRRAETVRPPPVRQCRACDRDVARGRCLQDRPRGVRGRHRRRRMAGADAAAVIGRAGRAGARGLPRSGSTAGTMPRAAASPPPRSAISKSACRARWSSSWA